MAKTQVWRKIWAAWKPVLSFDFWLWAFPRQPLTSLAIIVMILEVNYIDLRGLRFSGERMD